MAGDEEVNTSTLDIRSRDGTRLGKLSLDAFEEHMVGEYPESIPLPGIKFNNQINKS